MYHRPNQTDIFVSYLSVTYFQFKFQKAWVTERERSNFRFFDSKLASKRNLAYSQCERITYQSTSLGITLIQNICIIVAGVRSFVWEPRSVTNKQSNKPTKHSTLCVSADYMRVTRIMMNFPDIYGLFDTNTVKKPFVTSASFAFVSRLSKQEAQLMLTNPGDAFRGQSRSPNSSIPYVRHSFLLCNSNFVFKTRRFTTVDFKKMSWPWNRG